MIDKNSRGESQQLGSVQLYETNSGKFCAMLLFDVYDTSIFKLFYWSFYQDFGV